MSNDPASAPSGGPSNPAIPHLEACLQKDLDRISQTVIRMGRLCEGSLQDALRSLLQGDRQLAYAVIVRDQRIDALENELGHDCLRFLVKYAPVGGPLRYAYGAIRASMELERVGDYAESIARQALKLDGYLRNVPVARFQRIADLSMSMLRDTVRAFAAQDAGLAARAIAVEETVDALRTELNGELVTLFRDGKLAWDQLHPLMTIARRLERVSDQARSLCLETIYACTGEDLKHPGAGTFRVLFVDRHQASLAPMAEAIGRSLNESRFVFASAGVEPKPVDLGTVRFMEQRGFDLSRVMPQAVTEVPELDRFDVVVALDPEGRKVFPTRPRRFVCLEWPLQEPADLTEDQTTKRSALEANCNFLREHIQALVRAILGEEGPARQG